MRRGLCQRTPPAAVDHLPDAGLPGPFCSWNVLVGFVIEPIVADFGSGVRRTRSRSRGCLGTSARRASRSSSCRAPGNPTRSIPEAGHTRDQRESEAKTANGPVLAAYLGRSAALCVGSPRCCTKVRIPHRVAADEMLPVTVQFIVAMLAFALNERMVRKAEYLREENRALKEALRAATGRNRIPLTNDRTQLKTDHAAVLSLRHQTPSLSGPTIERDYQEP
jgi:hypothetical protein